MLSILNSRMFVYVNEMQFHVIHLCSETETGFTT